MSRHRFQFGKVLPEIRDMLLTSPKAIEMMEAATAYRDYFTQAGLTSAALIAAQNQRYELASNDKWTVNASFVSGSGRILTIANDSAAVITGNIIRIPGELPASLVHALPGKPLRTLIDTGFPQMDASLIDQASEVDYDDNKYLVITIKQRMVILSRNPAKHRELARKLQQIQPKAE